MLLKTRLTLLVVAAATTSFALSGTLLWWHHQKLTSRYHEALLISQRSAWERLQSGLLASLQNEWTRITSQHQWVSTLDGDNKQGLAELLQSLPGQPAWRADVFDAGRSLLFSTSTHWREEPLIESGWVARALLSDQAIVGLSQVSRDRYDFVLARSFGEGAQRGVLAVGADVSLLLPELSRVLGGDSVVINLRGRVVAATSPGVLQQGLFPLSPRRSGVTEISRSDDRHALAVMQPLAGPERRHLGGLLWLKDVTRERAEDRRELAIGGALGVLLLLALGWATFSHLRQALWPLHRSLHVLDAIACGDLHNAPEERDQSLQDEAGQIARGVETLREEMLSLQMLREERIRTREQQERLIRAQLKNLAESLESGSRDEILQALQPDTRHEGNDLAQLAGILARLSGLVTTQQTRLLQLLQDLRAAMAQQAVLVSLKQELEIARRMQLAILPRQAPETAAVSVEALMLPAKEVGGDFYDYFMLANDRLAMVVADVSGKGVPAAFFMAIARTLLKSSALFSDGPGNTIARLNDQLCEDNDQMMFVTAFFAELHLGTGELVYVNAGHNPPVLRTHQGDVRLLPGGGNTALAVMEGLPYAEGRLTLARGDALLLYTDGVTEATNAHDRLFGNTALIDAVRAHGGATGLPDAVLAAVRAFEDGAAQADDITCVSVCYQGSPS